MLRGIFSWLGAYFIAQDSCDKQHQFALANYVGPDGYSQQVKLLPHDASSSYRALYQSLQTEKPDCCEIRPYTLVSPDSSTMWWPNKGKKVTLDPDFFNEKIAQHCTWPSSGTIGKPERTLYDNFKSTLKPKQPPDCKEEESCSPSAAPL